MLRYAAERSVGVRGGQSARAESIDPRAAGSANNRKEVQMLSAAELLGYLSYPVCLDYLADDVEWHLPVGLWEGVGGAHVGRAAVEKMLHKVMAEFYDPATIEPEITCSFGDETHATIVFTMTASTRWGERYRNGYAITIEACAGKIARVYEVFDTKNLFDTVDNTKLGPCAAI
ncbi:nuclear transport factor 2 family protein [Mycolicibacterium neoaurum]|uniref:nuclear transport factor 2 family protein n=1 Tax=Mycolicibacterium neoaurum TaxID=1795 RepID=UPI00267413AF|nr:nuclear transport factor 2 family protein [Mycolicibacterium neoaurum]MDO3401702.1 nuclear transport factor 2 family protein [Mycolicibacterium neoaurum]